MAALPSTPSSAYRKLTRMKRGFGLLSQLWLGNDHLLYVTSTGYTETYRRFYLRDIQSMLIVHTARRTYYAATLILLMLFSIMIVNSADGGMIGLAINLVIFLSLLVWNHLLGAGCRVVMISAVQQENVKALTRLPKTRRVLGELKPLIEAAQADQVPVPVPVAEGQPEVPVPPVVSAPALPPPLPPS